MNKIHTKYINIRVYKYTFVYVYPVYVYINIYIWEGLTINSHYTIKENHQKQAFQIRKITFEKKKGPRQEDTTAEQLRFWMGFGDVCVAGSNTIIRNTSTLFSMH